MDLVKAQKSGEYTPNGPQRCVKNLSFTQSRDSTWTSHNRKNLMAIFNRVKSSRSCREVAALSVEVCIIRVSLTHQTSTM